MPDFGDIGKELLHLIIRPRYSFALWVAALILLVFPLPDSWHMEQVRKDWTPYVALVFLFCLVLWVVEIGLLRTYPNNSN